MQLDHLFDKSNLLSVFCLLILGSYIIFEVGYGIGGFVLRLNKQKKFEMPSESMASGILGLFAFILAFTFSLAATRFDDRRDIVLQEANAIGTTYLRAGYLEEPYKSKIRSLLKEYTSVRLEAVKTKKYAEAIAKSDELQNALWDQVVLVVQKGYDSYPVGLLISSLNEVIDLHSKRILFAFEKRVPEVIWLVLFSMLLLAIWLIGYLSGLKQSRNLVINLATIFAFCMAIYLIMDLDQPQKGFLTVSQQPLADTLNKMNSYK